MSTEPTIQELKELLKVEKLEILMEELVADSEFFEPLRKLLKLNGKKLQERKKELVFTII